MVRLSLVVGDLRPFLTAEVLSDSSSDEPSEEDHASDHGNTPRTSFSSLLFWLFIGVGGREIIKKLRLCLFEMSSSLTVAVVA